MSLQRTKEQIYELFDESRTVASGKKIAILMTLAVGHYIKKTPVTFKEEDDFYLWDLMRIGYVEEVDKDRRSYRLTPKGVDRIKEIFHMDETEVRKTYEAFEKREKHTQK